MFFDFLGLARTSTKKCFFGEGAQWRLKMKMGGVGAVGGERLYLPAGGAMLMEGQDDGDRTRIW
jgi:hypothetical protein